jgi:YVTN family beta-propeller protein
MHGPMRRFTGGLWLVLCAALISGCTGGGANVGTSRAASQSQATVVPAASLTPADGNVSFVIRVVPDRKAGRLKPAYVSPSTASLQILTDGTHPVIVNLTPSAPNCVPNAAVPGSYICIGRVAAAAGSHVFTVTTYDGYDGEGNVLSTNSTGIIVVKTAGLITIPIVLEGVVQFVLLRLATTNPAIGTGTTIDLTPVLEDADYNLIVGPAPYEYPVHLTTSDSTNGALSKALLASPADATGITVRYTGADLARIVYSATATDLPAANVTDAILYPGAPVQSAHLYITNSTENSVSVFDPAHLTAAPTTIAGGLDYPAAVTVDAVGNLYVLNAHAPTNPLGNLFLGNPSVSIFDGVHGYAALPTITGASLASASSLAIDASGKLYVPNSLFAGFASISVFDTLHGDAVLPAITGGGLNAPFGVAVDSGGKLYVANTLGGSVSVFDTARGNAAEPAITSPGLCPSGAAISASGKLYVGNPCDFSVRVFDTLHGNQALPSITGGNLQPSALALDPSGDLYVLNANGSVSFCDTTLGNIAHTTVISRYGAGLNGIAVH